MGLSAQSIAAYGGRHQKSWMPRSRMTCRLEHCPDNALRNTPEMHLSSSNLGLGSPFIPEYAPSSPPQNILLGSLAMGLPSENRFSADTLSKTFGADLRNCNSNVELLSYLYMHSKSHEIDLCLPSFHVCSASYRVA